MLKVYQMQMRELVSFVQFKKHEEKHGGMLLLVKLQAYFSKSNTPWVFFIFLKLYKWYQIVQHVL